MLPGPLPLYLTGRRPTPERSIQMRIDAVHVGSREPLCPCDAETEDQGLWHMGCAEASPKLQEQLTAEMTGRGVRFGRLEIAGRALAGKKENKVEDLRWQSGRQVCVVVGQSKVYRVRGGSPKVRRRSGGPHATRSLTRRGVLVRASSFSGPVWHTDHVFVEVLGLLGE